MQRIELNSTRTYIHLVKLQHNGVETFRNTNGDIQDSPGESLSNFECEICNFDLRSATISRVERSH